MIGTSKNPASDARKLIPSLPQPSKTWITAKAARFDPPIGVPPKERVDLFNHGWARMWFQGKSINHERCIIRVYPWFKIFRSLFFRLLFVGCDFFLFFWTVHGDKFAVLENGHFFSGSQDFLKEWVWTSKPQWNSPGISEIHWWCRTSESAGLADFAEFDTAWAALRPLSPNGLQSHCPLPMQLKVRTRMIRSESKPETGGSQTGFCEKISISWWVNKFLVEYLCSSCGKLPVFSKQNRKI